MAKIRGVLDIIGASVSEPSAPTYVRTCVRVHVRPPDCACAKVVGILLSLLVLKNQLVLQLLVPGAGYVRTSQTQQESDRQARLERRRQLDRENCARETLDERNIRSLRQERLRDGYDSTPDPASSSLRCSAQKQTATWLLYRVLYSLLAAVVSAISLTLAHTARSE